MLGQVMRRRTRRALGGAAALLLLAPAAPAAAAGVLVVGDSLGVGTAPYLKHDLPGVPIRFDVLVGRPSSAGPGLVARELDPGDQVLVFDLGTNDSPGNPAQLSSDLAAARRLAGNRCMVVATLNRPVGDGGSVAGLNAAVRAFGASAPNVLVVPWHEEAHSTPGLLGPDAIHGTAVGYATRGQIFAQAVEACLSAPTTAVPAEPIAPLSRAPGSTTISPPPAAVHRERAAAARPVHRGPDRAVVYGTLAALVGRLVDVVSGNLEA